MFSSVNNASARQLTKKATQEPTPHAALTAMSPMQNGLFIPALGPMIRSIRARSEHLARLNVKRLRIVAASVD